MRHKVKAVNEIEINTYSLPPYPPNLGKLLFCQQHLQIIFVFFGGGGGDRGYYGALEDRERFSAQYQKPIRGGQPLMSF